ncbi:hypothetical protein B0H10DRAFT_486894 [Mycena sp. CBHHK59/15]|nr:hypothetical protein B0H10DRAFT_486894 [Mycena sp. CBHHK59/15]
MSTAFSVLLYCTLEELTATQFGFPFPVSCAVILPLREIPDKRQQRRTPLAYIRIRGGFVSETGDSGEYSLL